MRHRNAGFKLGRNPSHRRALLRNLVTSIILMDRVETTLTKCKATQPLVEKMITLGKRGTVHARRQALAFLMGPEAGGPNCSAWWPRATPTATAAIPESRAAAHARAMPRRWRTSSCWEPSKSWTRSARSVKKPAPRSVRSSRSSWKNRIRAEKRRRRDDAAA